MTCTRETTDQSLAHPRRIPSIIMLVDGASTEARVGVNAVRLRRNPNKSARSWMTSQRTSQPSLKINAPLKLDDLQSQPSTSRIGTAGASIRARVVVDAQYQKRTSTAILSSRILAGITSVQISAKRTPSRTILQIRLPLLPHRAAAGLVEQRDGGYSLLKFCRWPKGLDPDSSPSRSTIETSGHQSPAASLPHWQVMRALWTGSC